MDEIESISLPAHAKYKTGAFQRCVSLQADMLWWVSAVSVAWGLTLRQRFVRGLSLALWPNRGNQSLWLGFCHPWSRATRVAVSRRGHSCLPERVGTGQGAASSWGAFIHSPLQYAKHDGQERHPLKVEKDASPFLLSLAFPFWMNPPISGISGI